MANLILFVKNDESEAENTVPTSVAPGCGRCSSLVCPTATPIKRMGEAGAAPTQRLTSWCRGREVCLRGDMADISQDSIVTYGCRPRHWCAAITPIRRSGTVTHSKTITGIVTPDDFESEPDAQFAAEKMIRNL
jgi:hypothetical protein